MHSRPGYIYVLQMYDSPHRFTSAHTTGCAYKIGLSIIPISRHKTIDVKSPYLIELLHTIAVDDMLSVERYFHKRLAAVHLRGEWFRLTEEQVHWFSKLELNGWQGEGQADAELAMYEQWISKRTDVYKGYDATPPPERASEDDYPIGDDFDIPF
jgi:hypothetical protein